MDSIHFRFAKLEDLETLYEFEQGIITAERPFDPTLKPSRINYYDLRGMITAEDTAVIVALHGEQVIGSAYAKIKASQHYLKFEHHAYVGFVFVRPEFRGQRVSQQILEELKPWARSKGLTEMRLDVYEDNAPAVKAYEKAGFQKHLVNMRIEI